MNSALVGSIRVWTGETAWVVYNTEPISSDNVHRGAGRFFKGKDASMLTGPDLRAILYGEHIDGSRILYDCSLRSREDG